MKRFHVHLHVEDLARNIAFYNQMFNQTPARTENDYAKWMLDDPPVNFAISTRGQNTGLDHFGFQVDSEEDLQVMRKQAQGSDLAMLDEGMTTCCYARSDKYWVTDPQGVAWEQFRTLDNIPVFRESVSSASAACCAPRDQHASTKPQSACCDTDSTSATDSCCSPEETTSASCCSPAPASGQKAHCC